MGLGRRADGGAFTYFEEGAMRHSRKLRLSAIVALGATAAVVLAATASGGQVFRETIHDEGTIVLDEICDVPGLTVELAFVVDLSVHVVPHGPDGLAYFLQHGTVSEMFTSLANGKSVTSVSNVIEKDLRVTDNGDGTQTVLILATGNAVLYGDDGKAIARNPGQVRFEIFIDEAGDITFLGLVKGSTGRSDDFCEAAVPALS